MLVSKSTYAIDRDEDLRSYLDAEVSCVEFSVKRRVSLDLNCGKSHGIDTIHLDRDWKRDHVSNIWQYKMIDPILVAV